MPQEFAELLNFLTISSVMWGPFFFSLLFMLFITKKAHLYFQAVITRADPPAEDIEKVVYKNYFVTSFVCGIALVFISVGWWVYAQLQLHAFEGVIVGLEQNQEIYPIDGEIYLKKINRDIGVNGQKLKEYHFAIVRNKPFSNGQSFEFGFYPTAGGLGDSPPEPVKIYAMFSGEASEYFQLTSANGTFKLVKINK